MEPLDHHQIIVTVNGPGEISGWLYPFATTLKRRAPRLRICVAVLPYVFASGAEVSVVKTIEGIDAVAGVKETMRYLYGGPLPAGFEKGRPGCLVHFGGEPFLSFVLARKWRYACLAYIETSENDRPWFARVFVTDESALPRRSSDGRSAVVGNMMVDAAWMRTPHRQAPFHPPQTIGIFPGSRTLTLKHLLPFCVKVAGLAAPALPQARWMLAKADYISLEELKAAAGDEAGRVLEGESARWEKGGPLGYLVSPRGIRLEIQTSGAVMAESDLAVTFPGTNTAELAALGVPMIVLLPTHYPELYPFPGLIGYLHTVPLVGKPLKRSLLLAYFRRVRWLALPNRKLRREVVPELSGAFTAEEAAAKLLETVHGPLERVGQELREVMGPPGAAERLVDEIMAYLRGGAPV